jgi:hypothetical protein
MAGIAQQQRSTTRHMRQASSFRQPDGLSALAGGQRRAEEHRALLSQNRTIKQWIRSLARQSHRSG